MDKDEFHKVNDIINVSRRDPQYYQIKKITEKSYLFERCQVHLVYKREDCRVFCTIFRAEI